MAYIAPQEPITYPLYANAILLPLLSVIAIFLNLPTLFLHFRNRHVGACGLVLWICLMNLINFIDALIWPRDDLENRWKGSGLCDIEVRIVVGSWIAIPGALMCIMSDLAKVMDTKHMTVSTTRGDRRRKFVFEMVMCLILPLFFMLVYYVVQPIRYYIWGISGCTPGFDTSWLSVALVFVWPVFLSLLNAYYSCLLIYRLYRYRKEFSHLLQASSISKSRFLRLFILGLVLVFFILPTSFYTCYRNVAQPLRSYSWTGVHDENWDTVILVRSYGYVIFDRWLEVGSGFLVFCFFGFGREATSMYKQSLIKCGIAKCFPGLRSTGGQSDTHTSRLSLLSRKCKGLTNSLKTWKSSRSSFTTSNFSSTGAPILSTPNASVQPRQSLVSGFWARMTYRSSGTSPAFELQHQKPLPFASVVSEPISPASKMSTHTSGTTNMGTFSRLSLGLSDLEETDQQKRVNQAELG